MKNRNHIFTFSIALSLLFCFAFSSFAQEHKDTPSGKAVNQKIKKLQIPFIANEGQIDEQVVFYANTFGGVVYVTKKAEIVYDLPKHEKDESDSKEKEAAPHKQQKHDKVRQKESRSRKGIVLKEEIVNGFQLDVTGGDKAETVVNYFIGNDPEQWRSNIPTYNDVSLGEIFPGVKLSLKAYGNNVEKIFHIEPGINPGVIQLRLHGAKGIRVDEQGELIADTEHGLASFTAPIAYQYIDGEKVEVTTKYAIKKPDPVNGDKGLVYGFQVSEYDASKELIIDPLLASTYLGGSYIDYGCAIALDGNNNIYVTGFTSSSNFPTTSGAYNTSENGTYDVFISKLDSSLTSLQASTYLGGSDHDEAFALALDGNNNVYVTGYTKSSYFPTTNEAYDTSYEGDTDVFISKLDSSLTSLQASTYLGGYYIDYAYGIALDGNNNVYVTGYTISSDFPTTSGAYDTSYNNSNDVFISKLDSSLTSLQASTYLGGSSEDYGYAIAIDVSNNVYVTGYTESGDYPTTSGAYATSLNGSNDLLISKLNSSLTSLQASTYLGGSSKDYGYAITTDMSDNVYVTGYTTSRDFPTTSDVYDSGRNGSYDIFISKLDNSLSVSAPTASTNSATNITINSATLYGTVNANDRSTTAWFEYGLYSGLYDYSTSAKTISGTSDETISISISNLYAGTKYYYRIVAENDIGTTYGDEMYFTTLSDTSKPSGSISINSGNSYTNSANVTLKLSALDDVGITGYYISTSSSTPSTSSSGWTSISSTTNYSASISYTLDSGDGIKTIYVWYKDDASNISDTYDDSITLDTTLPEITITSPTANDTYSTTISVVSIWGNASDATSGIASITWSNNKGGSGTASGTTSWSISNIGLLVDAENIITVTATDNAGNSASDKITVTYSELTAAPTTTPTPTPTKLGALFGSVVDTEGKPIANATVFTDKGGYSAKNGSNGIYQLNDVAEGSYLLTALAEGYGSVSQAVTVTAGETTQADFTLLRAITIPTPVPSLSPSVNPAPSTTPTPVTSKGKIFGYVADETNSPVKKAKVRCKGKNSNYKEVVKTNKEGYFELNDLDADTYKITAKKKGYYKSIYNVNIETGEEKEIEIVLEEK